MNKEVKNNILEEELWEKKIINKAGGYGYIASLKEIPKQNKVVGFQVKLKENDYDEPFVQVTRSLATSERKSEARIIIGGGKDETEALNLNIVAQPNGENEIYNVKNIYTQNLNAKHISGLETEEINLKTDVVNKEYVEKRIAEFEDIVKDLRLRMQTLWKTDISYTMTPDKSTLTSNNSYTNPFILSGALAHGNPERFDQINFSFTKKGEIHRLPLPSINVTFWIEAEWLEVGNFRIKLNGIGERMTNKTTLISMES